MSHINGDFLITAFIIHQFVDWVFQHTWQATNKSNWGKGADKNLSAKAVVSHSFIVSLSGPIICLIVGLPQWALLVMWTIFITHAIIDTRILVKWIMKLKGLTNDEINDTKNYGFMHIGIDHRLHELVLLILAFFVK